jgi:hypothetical protein
MNQNIGIVVETNNDKNVIIIGISKINFYNCYIGGNPVGQESTPK